MPSWSLEALRASRTVHKSQLSVSCHDIPLFKGSVAGLPLICTEAEHKGIRPWAGPTSKKAPPNHQYNLFKPHVHALPVNLDISAPNGVEKFLLFITVRVIYIIIRYESPSCVLSCPSAYRDMLWSFWTISMSSISSSGSKSSSADSSLS
jgi:hypothetical protein